MEKVIKIQNLHKKFKENQVFKNLNFQVEEKEFLTILGPSGCGKTTLVNLMSGFELPDQGEVLINNKPITKPSTETGVIFQEKSLFPWRNALQNVILGLNKSNADKDKKTEKGMEILKTIGLEGHEHKYPKELSGGMAQRVAIARLLIHDSNIMLMDEPFVSLDSQAREKLQNLVLNIWQKFNKTIVFVTHDIEEALFLGQRLIIFNKQGKIVYNKNITHLKEKNNNLLLVEKEKIKITIDSN